MNIPPRWIYFMLRPPPVHESPLLPKTDMSAFSEAHPAYSAGLLSFVLEYMTFTFWPTNSFIPQANVCQTSCSTGQEESFCGCTCMIDAFAIDDEQVGWVGGWVRVLRCPRQTNGNSVRYLISAICVHACMHAHERTTLTTMRASPQIALILK